MSHRILFSDIDGTLLNAEKELSELTVEQIKRVTPTIPFILVSSRMPSAMTHLQEKLGILGSPLICYNGGLVLTNEKTISSTTIPVETVEILHQINTDQKVHISLYNHDDWYVPTMDFWANREINNTKVKPTVKSTQDVIDLWKQEQKGAHKIMCMGEEEYIDRMYIFLEENHGDSLHLYRSKSTYIEIASKNISKLTGIKQILTQCYNLPLDSAVAFGDNYNDIEMLQHIGTGVAVSNAKPEVLAVADQITTTSKEDGVALFIQKHI